MKINITKKKIVFITLLVILFVLILALNYVVPRVSIGVAYKAKMLCSGVFISKRDPESVLSIDLSVDDLALMQHFETEIDHSNKTVNANIYGFLRKTYQYREGLGCTQIHSDYPTKLDFKSIASTTQSSYRLTDAVNPKLKQALDWAFSEPNSEKLRRTRAIVVLHKGRLVAERYAPGFNKDTALQAWSMGKSVVNALVGIAVQQGKLSITMPAPIPEWQTPGDSRAEITIDHLLHMESGLEFNENYYDPLNDASYMLFASPDIVAFAIDRKQSAKAGTAWQYSSGTSNILTGILHDIIGDPDYLGFPRRELFNPLGMSQAVLEPDAAGTFVGSSFMYASARDWAKFGQLYIQDGIWQGQRMLPEDWVSYSRTPAKSAPDEQYGAHFWLSIPEHYRDKSKSISLPKDTFHAIGRSGQFVTIVPSQALVVVRLGLTRKADAWPQDSFVQMVLDAI